MGEITLEFNIYRVHVEEWLHSVAHEHATQRNAASHAFSWHVQSHDVFVLFGSPQIGPVHDDVSPDDELGAAALGAVPERHVVPLRQADDGSHLFNDPREHVARRGRRRWDAPR